MVRSDVQDGDLSEEVCMCCVSKYEKQQTLSFDVT